MTGNPLKVEVRACVFGCSKQDEIPYFLFPTDGELSDKWLDFVRARNQKQLHIHQYLQVCGRHFVASDYIEVNHKSSWI